MKLHASIGIAAVLALSFATGGSAVSDPSPAPAKPRPACFWARDVNGFAAVDDRTVNLRIGVHDVYQLKLFGNCPDIDWSMRIGIKSRGSSWICEGNGLDLELVSPSPIGPERCPVTSVRKLTTEEVTAIPKRQRP